MERLVKEPHRSINIYMECLVKDPQNESRSSRPDGISSCGYFHAAVWAVARVPCEPTLVACDCGRSSVTRLQSLRAGRGRPAAAALSVPSRLVERHVASRHGGGQCAAPPAVGGGARPVPVQGDGPVNTCQPADRLAGGGGRSRAAVLVCRRVPLSGVSRCGAASHLSGQESRGAAGRRMGCGASSAAVPPPPDGGE